MAYLRQYISTMRKRRIQSSPAPVRVLLPGDLVREIEARFPPDMRGPRKVAMRTVYALRVWLAADKLTTT